MNTVLNGKIIPEDDARRMVAYARAQGWLATEGAVLMRWLTNDFPSRIKAGKQVSWHSLNVLQIEQRSEWRRPHSSEISAVACLPWVQVPRRRNWEECVTLVDLYRRARMSRLRQFRFT